ncbi:MAG: sugar ABC transporter permease [Alphaproteobacteria bacterium]|nr:MAG: sugar ABC transporter permease [Alphaproteobacteria bacterium]
MDNASAPPGRGALSDWWWRNQRALTPFILLAPACLLFAVFVLYPIAASIRLSLHDWDGVGPQTWVGLANFAELFGDPVFYTALANNLCWLALYLLAPVFGLGLALFLNQDVRGIRVVRSLFLFPFVISQVVVGLIFAWFLNAEFGLLNRLLGSAGLPAVAPLESGRWAIFAVILAGLWPQTAYCMILYLTGLTGIRPELIESARMDGARGGRLLWHVVLPQLRPVTFIAAMVCVVGALRSFDLVAIMTAGGPYNSTMVLGYYMYEQTFLSLRYGYGAAIAAVLFALMGAFVGLFLWRLLRREAA